MQGYLVFHWHIFTPVSLVCLFVCFLALKSFFLNLFILCDTSVIWSHGRLRAKVFRKYIFYTIYFYFIIQLLFSILNWHFVWCFFITSTCFVYMLLFYFLSLDHFLCSCPVVVFLLSIFEHLLTVLWPLTSGLLPLLAYISLCPIASNVFKEK